MVFNAILGHGYPCAIMDRGPINIIAVLAFGQTDYYLHESESQYHSTD